MDAKLMLSGRGHRAEIQRLGIAPCAGLRRQSVNRAPDFDVVQFDIRVRRDVDSHLFFGCHRQVFAGDFDAQIFEMDSRARFNDQDRSLQGPQGRAVTFERQRTPNEQRTGVFLATEFQTAARMHRIQVRL
ncbi:hypothetical protein LBMAG52_05330 [Planctomycetia bacterium]|nr:hypothetical protein LBMAG52_05330 [Planctomycetia bacterium]